MDGSILNTRFLAPNRVEETYLSIVDQFGFSTAVAAWGDAWFEGNIGAQFRKFDDNKAGGRIRYIHPITDRLAFTVAGGLNETLISTNNTGSVTVGLEFGKWLSPKGYGETEGPVPVDVPRVRYEVLTRTIRTGNDAPVADAGPDQMGVEAGTISLDGSGSSDPDDDPITFAWEQVGGPGVTLSSPTTAQTTFTADEGETYHFRLTVRDDQNGVGTDRVTVSTLDRQITILRFSAEPLRITSGEAATLVWEVRNATNVEISGIGEVDPAGGSSTVSPTDTTTYTLTASNPRRTLNQTVTVTVDPPPDPDPPIIANFFASPASIALGDPSTLSWEVRNATDVTISGIGAVDPQGSRPVTPDQTTTYTITARNGVGEASANATVTVRQPPDPGPPLVINFFASPASIVLGSSSTLSWEVRNATDVTISGIGAVDPQGSRPVTPDQTTTYTITARNGVGEASSTATVTVRELGAQVEILTFSAAPGQLAQAGDPTVLRWATRNATKVVITGVGEVALSGEVTVNPTVDTTYTLNATDLDGTEATAVVLVTIETRNRAPVAIATADWLIRGDGAGTIGTINGSASFDPDGDPITLIWRNVGDKAAEILDQGAERPRVRFTGGRGLYEFELEVVDDKGLRSFARESLIVGDP